MKLKKLFIALIMIVASLSLASCSNTDNPDDSGNTNNEVTYPYMDYLEQKVYARVPDASIMSSLNNSKYFKAIGTANIDEVTKTTKVDFGGVYDSLVFTAKQNVEVISITFTISSKKDVYLEAAIAGIYKKDNKFEFISTGTGSVDKIAAGTSKTYTINTYRNASEYLEAADYGIYDDSFSEWNRKLAISFMTYEWKEEYNTYGAKEGSKFVEKEYGIEIHNVSFNCKKLAN